MTGAVLVRVRTGAGLATETTAARAGAWEPAPAGELTAAGELAAASPARTSGPAGPAASGCLQLRHEDLVARRQTRRDLRLSARGDADLHCRLRGLAVLHLLDVLAAGRVAVHRRGGHDDPADLLVDDRRGDVGSVVQAARRAGDVDDDRVARRAR